MNFDWEDETLLITGGSSGLGEALALRAAELHSTVILIARNKARLDEVGNKVQKIGGRAFKFQFDLENVSQIPDLYKKIIKEVDKIPTILINNVGYQTVGFVANTPAEVYERNYRVNTLAPLALIQSVLPDMLKQKKGIIANVMSSIMYHSFPGVSPYSSSKKALGAIHESLKIELSGTPIKTLYIRPGSFKSDYWKNTDVGDRVKEFKLPSTERMRDPYEVAKRICTAIEKGKEDFNLSTFKDEIGYNLSYWSPRLLRKIIVAKNRALLSKRPY